MSERCESADDRKAYWLNSWDAPSNDEIEALRHSSQWQTISEADRRLYTRIEQGRRERGNAPLKCRYSVNYDTASKGGRIDEED